MAGFPTFKGSYLDIGSGHTPYHHASLIDLYLHSKFNQNQRNFLWTLRTNSRTDIWDQNY